MTQNGNSTDNEKIIHEAEIIEPDNNQYRQNDSSYRRSYGGTFMTYSPVDGTGCLSGFVTLALFLVCLGQFGLLAAIGFMVFYGIGAIMGTLRNARLLMAGYPPSLWGWRLGNWVISFMLTAWLAGGFNQ